MIRKMMMTAAFTVAFSLTISGCGSSNSSANGAYSAASAVVNNTSESSSALSNTEGENEEESEMKLTIGNTHVNVSWENNESVEALKQLASDGTLTVQMSMYGGFEQVGDIGSALPRNDVQTTAASGDIVLYSGDKIVIFYGSNSWAYTKLGHITNKSEDEMAELLSNGDTTITISSAE